MKVSICIPQYNRCEKLRLVINDILSQTYEDFELLIVDDASTDETPIIISEFNDPRLRYVRNKKNLGLYPNFNRCIELSRGEYIAIYHNHDRYEKDIIERSVKILDSYRSVGFVHTGTVSWFNDGRQRSYVQGWPEVADGRWFLKHLIRRWDSPVHQPTVMARRSFYDRVRKFDNTKYFACADVPVWMEMCVIGDVGYIPIPLMRVTPRQEGDYYFGFHWNDVIGMARAHRFGLELLFPESDYTTKKEEELKLQLLHDYHLLILFTEWVIKDDQDLVEEAIWVIDQEGSDRAKFLAVQIKKILSKKQKYILLPIDIYREVIRIKERLSHLRGVMISRKYGNQKRNN